LEFVDGEALKAEEFQEWRDRLQQFRLQPPLQQYRLRSTPPINCSSSVPLSLDSPQPQIRFFFGWFDAAGASPNLPALTLSAIND
jgi:hypothetical protein